MKEKNETIYATGYRDGLAAGQAPRNQAAFVVGILAGFFGIWGLAHILNDKVGMGCLWMFIVGPILGVLLGSFIVATAGVGAVIALPLWVLIVYQQAKNGASNL